MKDNLLPSRPCALGPAGHPFGDGLRAGTAEGQGERRCATHRQARDNACLQASTKLHCQPPRGGTLSECRSGTLSECRQHMGYFLTFQFVQAPYEFGEGYLSAVLMETLHNTFGDNAQLQKTLGVIAAIRPSHGSQHYEEGTAFVDSCFSELADILKGKLRYASPELESVFFGSIKLFLDERFSITNQRLLGFLPESE